MNLKELYKKLVYGSIHDDDLMMLYNYFESESREEIAKILSDHFWEGNDLETETEKTQIDHTFRNLIQHIRESEKPNLNTGHFKKWMLYAAVLLSALSFTLWTTIYKQDNRADSFARIVPGTNKAMITLPNGEVVTLDSLQSGVVFGNDLTYENGRSVLDAGNKLISGNVELYVPKGGVYRVTLTDGTKVWLNSDTRLSYPIKFNDQVRLVNLQGEGYFEVFHDKKRPFIVQSESQEIEVPGTNFNVRTYQDDQVSTTSLLEGAVKVKELNSKLAVVLKPGEKSLLSKADIQVRRADVKEDIAWKERDFVFNKESMSSVLCKISRWYDIDIAYHTEIKNIYFSGIVSRSQSIATILEMLEATEQIKFRTEGRRIIVME